MLQVCPSATGLCLRAPFNLLRRLPRRETAPRDSTFFRPNLKLFICLKTCNSISLCENVTSVLSSSDGSSARAS